MELRDIDIRISEVERQMDFYSCLRPLNKEEERIRFFDSIRKGARYDPVFVYKKADTRVYRPELENLRRSISGKSPMEAILGKKIDLLLGEIDLLDEGDDNLKQASASLYGVPGSDCLDLSRRILQETLEEEYIFPEETVTPEEMVSIMACELEKKGISWKCALSGKIVPKITVSPRDRAIYVNADINYTREEVARLKIHEIEVHVYRGINGQAQPFRIFAEGLAGYDETEEGLAIEVENISGVLEADTRQMKLYAARALCAGLSMEMGFYDAFKELSRFFPEDIAYRITERAKRGLRDTSRKGCLGKAFHYISGWMKVRKYVELGGDLSILYLGKIGLSDVEMAKELLDEGVLKSPAHLPEKLKDHTR